MPAPHRVVVAVFPDVDLLDVTGPAEVFAVANREMAGGTPYQVLLAGPDGGQVRTSAGVRLATDLSVDQVGERVDTLVVPGAVDGRGMPVIDPALVGWIGETARHAGRVASVCVGAHLLAAAGLLSGRTATTHWATADRLAAEHPDVTVDPDPIYVRSGNVWTGAGITACMDLALALVAEDHGERLALAVARQLVMYLKRPGGQSQFSVPLWLAPSERRDIDELRAWITANLAADLSAAALAERMCLSERHFARVFRKETGVTPAAYVEAARVEAARRLLEGTDEPLDQVAAACGLGSVETLHRAFRRRLGTTPAAYRRRFRTAA
ncbi:GlxA family transcriptional regulator [Nonomuraea roseoviolacea]|uniref:Transcriptional regulator GlxA family with amidase domain n=1 Tax=Nonomuraea roseoviolacea subsp. carminata TaxID=160689 RepID=A0ABT1K9N7_9ACTN|nr:helix-turn-helix domain-containing protein [Nonomuraea roseoviolacea]MCP2350319.1 transcriptional regulator GlxA family with amidase domain [Nonomuraea roseoviolacea subsp. carminata]